MCPVVPLGVPHGTLEEVETVCQWTIPQGTMLMVNHWAMNYNPYHYKDPQIFKPLRFLENEMKPMPFQVSMNSERSCAKKTVFSKSNFPVDDIMSFSNKCHGNDY